MLHTVLTEVRLLRNDKIFNSDEPNQGKNMSFKSMKRGRNITHCFFNFC